MRRQLGAAPSASADTATKGYVDSVVAAAVATGLPYDLSYMQCLGTRAAGLGDNVIGIKLQRAATFTSVTFRVGTADSSGNLVVELRKNGSTVTGTSTTIASGSQVSGGTSTGTWSFAAGDILTVYITSVPASGVGTGLVADIKGVTA